MADTFTASGLRVQQWDDTYFSEYVRESRFKPYMGTDENSIIQVKEDITKRPGDRITFALVNRLKNDGVTGSNMMEGNEEQMDQRSFLLAVDKLRNAVRIPEMEELKNAIDLRNAARAMLKIWSMEKLRDTIYNVLGSVNGVVFASSTEAQRDAWLDDNFDRVLFGVSLSNTDSTGGTVAYDYSDSLATIDNTADKMSPAVISLAKRIAQSASPKIRPTVTKGDEEWFVMWMNRLAYRDFKADTGTAQMNRDARERGKDNPIFKGADYVYDGVIIREMPEIPLRSNGTIQVGPSFLVGAQAVGLGWAKRARTTTKEFDYGDKWGVAVEEIRGVEKLRFGTGVGDTDDTKDTGVVTVWTAAVAD